MVSKKKGWIFGRNPKFKDFFRSKSGGLQKKKKKIFADIEAEFLAKIQNSKVFSAQNQVVSKQKKKIFAEIEAEFLVEIRNLKVFSAQNQVVSKKRKKKKVFAEIEADFSAQIGNPNVWGGAVFQWGGYFQFLTKNRPQNHQNGAILHTSQANGGGSSPSWLRYCSWAKMKLK